MWHADFFKVGFGIEASSFVFVGLMYRVFGVFGVVLAVVGLGEGVAMTHVARLGRSTEIMCASSQDDHHVFMYWHIPKLNVVIGPRNRFDHMKYDYDATSGNLRIRVSKLVACVCGVTLAMSDNLEVTQQG